MTRRFDWRTLSWWTPLQPGDIVEQRGYHLDHRYQVIGFFWEPRRVALAQEKPEIVTVWNGNDRYHTNELHRINAGMWRPKGGEPSPDYVDPWWDWPIPRALLIAVLTVALIIAATILLHWFLSILGVGER